MKKEIFANTERNVFVAAPHPLSTHHSYSSISCDLDLPAVGAPYLVNYPFLCTHVVVDGSR